MAACTALLVSVVSLGPAPATAAGSPLSIRMLTWNVLGLDSNDPTTGPNLYPVGARICNRGATTLDAVTAQLVLGSGSSYLSGLGPTSLPKGQLAAGRCVDAYFAVTVTRLRAAYDAVRGVRIVARATGVMSVSTPSPRELYVERLISQNRNQVLSITGPTTVYVGETYRFAMVSQTAPGGYEQLESHINLNPGRLELLRVATTYQTPAGATNDTVYADACGWDEVPTSPTYRSCVGPFGYAGGKAGGTIRTTYTVRVRSVGQSVLTGLIYDKSGSSYHYNTDFGTAGNRLVVTAVLPPDIAVTKTHATSPWTAGGTGTWTLTVRNVGGSPTVSPITVTDTVPVGTTVQSASGTGWSCTTSGRTVTCRRSAPLAPGASSAIVLVVHVASDAPDPLVNTVRAATAHDPVASNNVDRDAVPVAAPIAPAAPGATAALGATPSRRTAGRDSVLAAALPGVVTAPAAVTAAAEVGATGPLPLTGAPLDELVRWGLLSLLGGAVLLGAGRWPRAARVRAGVTGTRPRRSPSSGVTGR